RAIVAQPIIGTKMSMSNPPSMAWRRPWRRRLILCTSSLVVLAGLLAVYLYNRVQSERQQEAERELHEAIAEIDAIDPEWRLEQIEAKRRKVPDHENSARVIVAAHGALPKSWRSEELEHVLDNPPPALLPSQHEQKLRADLRPLTKALEQAHKLVDYPPGRHRVAYSPDFISTQVQDQESTREIGRLLELDVLLLLQDGKLGEAWSSCRALLNASRSMGDEPFLISQLIRISLQLQT